MKFFTKCLIASLSLILFANNILFANKFLPNVTIASMANGNWDNPATWIGGVVPSNTNCSNIEINNTVTVNTNTSIACNLTVNLSATLIINAAIDFNVIFDPATNLQTDAVLVFGTFENKGNFYEYGKFFAGPAAILKQTLATATFKMHASNGTAAGSIPNGTDLFTTSATTNTEEFTKGLLQFFEPPFGATSKTTNIGSAEFGYNNSELEVKFGPTATTNTQNLDGFILGFQNLFFCKNFTIDNGTGAGQIVSGAGYTIAVLGNMLIQNGTFRASNEPALTSGIFYTKGIIVAKSFINNGSVFLNELTLGENAFTGSSGPYTQQSKISGNGTWANTNYGIPKSYTGKILINTMNPLGASLEINNFSCSSIDLQEGKLFLNDNNLISISPYCNGGLTRYIVTNGNGKFIWRNSIDYIYQLSEFPLPIGSINTYAPIWITQEIITPQDIDDFSFRVLPLIGANDLSQTFPVMWEINEGTSGGNDGFGVEFEVTDYPTSSNFPPALGNVYHNTGSGWNKLPDNPFQYKYQRYYQQTQTYYPKSLLGFTQRGLFAIAAGRGIENNGVKVINSTGITNNWSQTSTWQGGIKPTANDIVNIKPGHVINVDEAAACNGLNIFGKLNIIATNTLTSGNTNGGNSGNYVLDELNIGAGTFNLNGEINLKKETFVPTNTVGKITMNGGTINVDPNSGNIATSVTKANARFQQSIFYVNNSYVNLAGSINFKDPIFDGDSTTAFCSTIPNQSLLPLNYTFGDGITTNSSNAKFGGDVSYVSSIDNVFINIGNENKTTMNYFNNPVFANNFTVQSGTFKNQNPTNTINLSGDLTINTNLNSSVSFVGTNRQHVSGNGFFTESNNQDISVQNETGVEINMPNKIIWDDGVNYIHGKIILNNTTIRYKANQMEYPFDTASYFITNGTSYVETEIAATANPTYYFPMGTRTGFSPISIKPAPSHVTDFITVAVADSVRVNGISGFAYSQKVVHKTWNILEQTIGGSNVTISPQWNPDDESSTFTYTSAYVTHFTAGIGWDLVTSLDNNPYRVSRANITSFSPFAVTSSATILPITWINFYATPNSTKNANLSWKVQESGDADYYWIEKSNDGIVFTSIAKIKSVGAGENIYNYIDQVALQKNTYYRIKEIDFAGKINYSKIVVLKTNQENLISVFANENTLQVNINNNLLGKSFAIFDTKGSVMQKGKLTQLQNSLYMPNLTKGIYFFKIENAATMKFIKK